jgi:hypothetical protein
LFSLSLSGAAFSWFTSLAPDSVNTWAGLEEKFHEYFYNGETEIKLSDLTSVMQKYIETVPEYIKRFRETRTKCYSLTVREKDHTNLAFAGLLSYLREKLEGQEFSGMSQVLQCVVTHENRVRYSRTHSRFQDGNKDREKGNVGLVKENMASGGVGRHAQG